MDEPSARAGSDADMGYDPDGEGLARDTADSSGYYPENLSMLRAELIVRCKEFANLRERYLLGFGYQTARAYWGDLESFFDWCLQYNVDVLAPQSHQVLSYLTEMLGRKYSPNTVARRRTTLRAFYVVVIDEGLIDKNPVDETVRPIPRRIKLERHARREQNRESDG